MVRRGGGLSFAACAQDLKFLYERTFYMKIITLTLNPAFDIHCYIENFAPYHENLANITEYDAGGKGVNISRALTHNGAENLALVVLGEENADSFRIRLERDGMNYRALCVSGRIRENITVHTNGADETRISFAGFCANSSLLERLERELDGILEEGSYVTFTGRNPAGLAMSDVKAFLRRLADKGARTVIDSRSFSLEDLIELRPWLIKPNQEEISEYLGRQIKDISDALDAARTLRESGIENVMISFGALGALLVCGDGAFAALPPSVEAVSTIGAGDSSIAGFLAAASQGKNSSDMLRTAVAYGTAACLTGGTRPPKAQDVERILKQIKLNTL